MSDNDVIENRPKFDYYQYNQQYGRTHYDRIMLTMPKGTRETMRARAEELGVSISGYVRRLLATDLASRQTPAEEK